MKIVDRKTFLELPKNTLFSKWEPCVFEELMIKDESLEDDFFCQEIVSAIDSDDSGDFCCLCDHASHTGDSIDIDMECLGRDGCFDDSQMFAVWEDQDVLKLIERLKKCLR